MDAKPTNHLLPIAVRGTLSGTTLTMKRDNRGPFRRDRKCLDCGLLGFGDGSEAGHGARLTIAVEGRSGWFTNEAAVDCAKLLRDWENGGPFSVITYEANRRCSEFLRYRPGRNASGHISLEDDRARWVRDALVGTGGVVLGAILAAIFAG